MMLLLAMAVLLETPVSYTHLGGTGGDEAAIFAGDLFRMYAKFCETKGWKLEVSSATEGAAGGYKEIICSVTGDNVYGTMKYESGVHRVQRVPCLLYTSRCV